MSKKVHKSRLLEIYSNNQQSMVVVSELAIEKIAELIQDKGTLSVEFLCPDSSNVQVKKAGEGFTVTTPITPTTDYFSGLRDLRVLDDRFEFLADWHHSYKVFRFRVYRSGQSECRMAFGNSSSS